MEIEVLLDNIHILSRNYTNIATNHQKKYLNEDLSVATMHRLYLEMYELVIASELALGDSVVPLIKYKYCFIDSIPTTISLLDVLEMTHVASVNFFS